MVKKIIFILIWFFSLNLFWGVGKCTISLEIGNGDSIVTVNWSDKIFTEDNESDKEDTSKVMKRENIEPLSESVMQRIINAFNIWSFNWWWVYTQWWTLYIKTVINYALSFLAFIALLIIIYWFFRMFFSWNHQESFDKAKKIIFTAIFALIIIWISWIVISWMFWLFFQIRGGAA